MSPNSVGSWEGKLFVIDWCLYESKEEGLGRGWTEVQVVRAPRAGVASLPAIFPVIVFSITFLKFKESLDQR